MLFSVVVIGSLAVLSHAFVTRRTMLPASGKRSKLRPKLSLLSKTVDTEEEEVDIIVIGSGIGGLSAASLLASYGKKVLVLEAHEHPGGVAHGFTRRTKDGVFKFDAGPSLWAGMSRPSTNPLRQVLDATGHNCEWVGYTGWGLHYLNEGYGFRFTVGPSEESGFDDVIRRYSGGGEEAVAEWHALLERVNPIITAAMGTPPMALRGDLGAAFTAAPATLSSVLVASLEAQAWAPTYLTGPFSLLMDRLENQWLKDWLDYLSFALSGLDATGTIAAAVVYTLGDLHRQGAVLDYPIGGSEAVVEALCRGVHSPNPPPTSSSSQARCQPGEVRLRTRVEEIVVDPRTGRAVGVRATKERPNAPQRSSGGGGIKESGSSSGGVMIRAREGVISNAPIWDTLRLIPTGSGGGVGGVGGGVNVNDALERWRAEKEATPATGSFVHLHLAIDGDGLPPDLDCHHSVITNWGLGITAPENMYIVSIPSLLDPSLAPPNKHVVHIYAAASEPWEKWQHLSRRAAAAAAGEGASSEGGYSAAEYLAAKEKAAEPLWRALEAIIPDVRNRTEVTMVGTPLTHQFFTRRHQGTYGPAGGKREGDLEFASASTPVPGLKLCGDSCFPGIGVPAAAASGIMAAHSFVPVPQHWKTLDAMRKEGTLCEGRRWWTCWKDHAAAPLPMAPGGRISVLSEEDSPEAVRYGGSTSNC